VDYATDEERVEELKKWWKENGKSVILGVALGLSVLFGWRWWGDYQETQAINASALYSQLELAIQDKKAEQAEAFADEVFKKHENSHYAIYSALSLAKMEVDNKNLQAAQTHLQWAYDHAGDDELKQLAGLRLARVILAIGETDKAYAIVNSTSSGKFAALYLELKGDILLKKDDQDGALLAYQKATQLLPAGSRINPALQFKIDDLAKVQ